MMVLLQAGLTGLLVRLWSEGKASAGDVGFAISAFMLMNGYLKNVGEQIRMLQKSLDDTEDVAGFMYEFWKAPRIAEVYNLGGGKDNSCSILEAFRMSEEVTGNKMNWRYIDENRIGDHICYYSDLRKMQAHYPEWKLTKSLPTIFQEIAESWKLRLPAGAGRA